MSEISHLAKPEMIPSPKMNAASWESPTEFRANR